MNTDITLLSPAYWIAFGPHGPRAQPPKGEGWRIFFKVTQLTAASLLVFYAIHYFAKPMPKTMSKEWQEASNEYAKVSIAHGGLHTAREISDFLRSFVERATHTFVSCRRSRSTPFTAARNSSRALPPRSHRWMMDVLIADERSADIGCGRGWEL